MLSVKAKMYSVAIVALSALTLLGLGQGQNGISAADKVTKVAILQYTEHESLDRSRKGFLDALKKAGYKEGKNLKVEYKNASGDQSNLQSIAQQLKGKHDIILDIATPAAQTMLQVDKKTPQLFTAVTDPKAAKLVESKDKPGKNMTGTSDMAPTSQVVDILLKEKEGIKTIGVLYNSSEVNSEMQYKDVVAYAKKKGIKVESVTVTSSNDVKQAIKALAKKVDAVYLPTDNTVADTIETIGEVLKEEKKPSVSAFDAAVKGSVCAYGVDYYQLGQQTGEMAVKILKGKKEAKNMPVELSKKPVLKVNKAMAKAVGVDLEKIQK
ncbi:ABC transporter substrate-binding protein [Atopobacter sp. AH10]|uniref:ABC transporter substrate-binding protein n=1 Tax=Atopobacter sp. AH10 TaxID=2315861 RepID=UPI000EF21C95|nr:ABC transporter substrate-binding protein [Atopobacter sp. AH10]RLK64168.1 ABC transporter substrate-binding protein [Atopobacter sp. AH10]